MPSSAATRSRSSARCAGQAGLVFELAFEGIQRSRGTSGIAVRFPRMARWRQDKKAEDADSLETIPALIG